MLQIDTMERPLVTIYIATQNRPQMLERAVLSCISQTYSPLEVIVVDDGSEQVNAQKNQQLLAAYPQVKLEVESTNRRVDLLHEGFDVALRVRFPPLENTDMVMKVLSNSTQCLVGQPQYLAQLPNGFDPQLLGTLPSVHWGSAQREYQWELFQGEDNSRSIVIPHTPRMVTDDLFALRHFVVAGVGIAHLPRVAVREDLASGRLVELLPEWHPRCGIVHAMFPSRRGLLPSVRALIDHLAEEFAISDMA